MKQISQQKLKLEIEKYQKLIIDGLQMNVDEPFCAFMKYSKIYFYLLSNSPNHHERRFYTTEAVSQRIPKITVFQFQTRSISIDSIQICPRTDVMPPGSFACDGATSWCRIVIYVTCTEFVSICICGSVAFYRVSYS